MFCDTYRDNMEVGNSHLQACTHVYTYSPHTEKDFYSIFHILMSTKYTHSSYIFMYFIHRPMYHLSLSIYVSIYPPTYLPTYLSVSVSVSISVSSLYCYDPQYSGSTPIVYMFIFPNVAEEARYSVIHLTSGIPTSPL